MKVSFRLICILLFSFVAVIGMAQQEFVESPNIEVGVPAQGLLTKTTAVTPGAGIFENQVTYVYSLTANPSVRASKVQYDANTGEYLLQSNGLDIWQNEDEIVYLWTTRPRSYRMTARFQYLQTGGSAWAKQGIMIRNEPESQASSMAMLQLRGDEDLTERSIRYVQNGAADHKEYRSPFANGETRKTVLLGQNALEPLWLRVTRIWPGNQLIFEDANESFDGDGTPAEEDWDLLNNYYAYADFAAGFPMPEELNWGIFVLDHQGADDITPPDEALIKNITLEPVVVGSRFLSESHFTGGDSIGVTITLNNEGNPETANVTEILPSGWSANNISDGGALSGGTISWAISNFQGLKDISYTLAPAAGATRGDLDGKVNGIVTAGQQAIGIAPAMIAGVGAFDSVSSIGASSTGSAAFNGGTYTLSHKGDADGSNTTIYSEEDALQFVWSAVSGDFVLEVNESNISVPGPVIDARVGVMVRDSLAATSSYLAFANRNDLTLKHDRRDLAGHQAFYTRVGVQFGGPGSGFFNDENIPAARNDFGGMRITREGKIFKIEFKDINNPDIWTTANAQTMAFTDPVYVGLYAASNAAGGAVEGTFTNVTLSADNTSVQEWSVY